MFLVSLSFPLRWKSQCRMSLSSSRLDCLAVLCNTWLVWDYCITISIQCKYFVKESYWLIVLLYLFLISLACFIRSLCDSAILIIFSTISFSNLYSESHFSYFVISCIIFVYISNKLCRLYAILMYFQVHLLLSPSYHLIQSSVSSLCELIRAYDLQITQCYEIANQK